MRKYVLSAVIATFVIGIAGCAGKTPVSEIEETEITESEIAEPEDMESEIPELKVPAQEIDPVTVERLQGEIDKNLDENGDYDEEAMREGYLEYSMRLFSESAEAGTNSMVSPVSVMMALDMAAAGANGETQSQITELFCAGAEQPQIEHFCRDLLERYESSQDVELHLANSIWIRDTAAERIKEDYLVRTDYIFDAEAVVAPFDETTVDAVNGWCDEKTDGMIERLLDEIPPNIDMILFNAAVLDAPWAKPYEDYQVTDETFTNAGGVAEAANMLNGTERIYFETEDAAGFMKYYEGYKYAFLAILPDERMTADEYVQSLTGEKYMEFWDSRTGGYEVDTKMPEFTYEYELLLNDVLADMGMTQAFDDHAADFSGITDDNNLYIERVLHKSFIEVGQNGTRAAAVTAVAMDTRGVAEPSERKEVCLDRPFVYAIVEADTGMPLFIGTVQSIQ